MATAGTGGNLYAIYMQSDVGTGSSTIRYNTITGGQRAVQFDGPPGITGLTTVANNTISGQAFGGITAYNNGDLIITNNVLTNAVRPIEFFGPHDVTISGNTINGSVYDGINAGSASGAVKINGDNKIYNIADNNFGIHVQGGVKNIEIDGNEIYGTFNGVNTGNGKGIGIESGATGAKITNNNIHNNSWGAIALNEVVNTITGNTINANARGIEAWANFTANNKNKFTNNLYCSACSYPLGTYNLDGNWWGTNQKSGIESQIPLNNGNIFVTNITYAPWYLDEAMTTLSSADTTGPTVVLSDDLSGRTRVKAGNIVNITATFSDDNGLASGVIPTISISGTAVSGTAMAGSENVWTYAWTVPAGDATANVSVTAQDAIGNGVSATTGTTSYTIDNSAPTVFINKDHADLIVRDADTVIITATFNEAMISVPTISVGSLITNAPMIHDSENIWIYSWDVPADNNGDVVATVAGADLAGNAYVGATSLIFTIDNSAPTTSLVIDPAAPNGTNGWYITSAPTVALTCADQAGLSGCSAIKYKWDSAESYSDYTVPLTVAEGTHTLHYYSLDNAGNSETAVTSAAIKVDTTNPALTLGSMFTDQTLTGGNTYPINWTASDLGSNFSGTPIKLEYSTDGGMNFELIAAATENDGSYKWTVPKEINSSSAMIQITATDLAGNNNINLSDIFTIAYSETNDETPPAVTLNSPNGGEIIQGGSTYVITWTATDENFGAEPIALHYSTNGGEDWSEIVAATANDGAYSWTVPDAASANALIKVTAVDSSDNTGFDISNAVFTITEQPPAEICDDNEDGTWTCEIPLGAGWNLISLPVIIDDTDIEDVVAGISESVNIVKHYDSTIEGNWLSYVPDFSGSTLATMEDGKGYWVSMTGNEGDTYTLKVTGVKNPEAPDPARIYDVIAGWNLIGFKSVIRMLSADYLQSLSSINYTLLDVLNVKKNAGYMNSGNGYWLWMGSLGSIVTSNE